MDLLQQPSNYTFVGKGEIVTALQWADPDESIIAKNKLEAGIKEYPPTLSITVTQLIRVQ